MVPMRSCQATTVFQSGMGHIRSRPMPWTDRSPALFEFPPVEGRAVVASFDGGAITSDRAAGALG